MKNLKQTTFLAAVLLVTLITALSHQSCTPEVIDKIIYDTTYVKQKPDTNYIVKNDTNIIVIKKDTTVNDTTFKWEQFVKDSVIYIDPNDPCAAEKRALVEVYWQLMANADSIMNIADTCLARSSFAFLDRQLYYLKHIESPNNEDRLRCIYQAAIDWRDGWPEGLITFGITNEINAIIQLYADREILLSQVKEIEIDVGNCINGNSSGGAQHTKAAAAEQKIIEQIKEAVEIKYKNVKQNRKFSR